MDAHPERHRSSRAAWLRAAVLGADDGLVSTAALLVGVAASGAARNAILVAGIAALTAGAMAMATGEYVSVSAQSDTESADRRREERELATDPDAELAELIAIYQARGLPQALATEVATTLHASDPLAAHLLDELGQTKGGGARPVQAAVTSAASFAIGAAVPLLAAAVSPATPRSIVIAAVTLVALCILGAVGASLGGASRVRGSLRIGVGGGIAMAVTYGVGALFGTVTG
ncbi:MAG TPA: VIT family protein [Acidimicrobiales bacterium]